MSGAGGAGTGMPRGSDAKNLRGSIRPPFASEARLVRQFGRVARSLRYGDYTGARRQLDTATQQLDRYLLSEESALIAPLESVAQVSNPAATRMRRGQHTLRDLMSALRDALDRFDRRTALVVVAALRSVLLLRETKKKWVIYPMLAQAPVPEPASAGCSLVEA